MPRLFVALPSPGLITDALAAVRTEADGVRWVRPEHLHLTLTFLGDVAPEPAEAVVTTLRAITASPVSLVLDRLTVFPNRRRPRVLVAALLDNAALLDLHEKVNAALARVGFEPEARPFRPHLTLARLRDPDPDALAKTLRQPLPGIAVTVEEFRLVESALHPDGARYTTRARYRLGQPSP